MHHMDVERARTGVVAGLGVLAAAAVAAATGSIARAALDRFDGAGGDEA